MTIEQTLLARADSRCELCGSADELTVFEVPPVVEADADKCILVCGTCLGQIGDADKVAPRHWRCLGDSMWSQVPAVQVMAWRMLKRLGDTGEIWAQDLLEMLYLDDATRNWAEADAGPGEESQATLDSNGTPLRAGDTVTLIKDLDVKGTSFVAKRGTAVRNISLSANPKHIEGRVNGTRIVIIAEYVRKSGG